MTWKNKHIVIVGPAHPLRGGLATYNERLARELMKNNHVTLLTFSLQYPNFLFPGQSQFSSDPIPQDLNIDVSLNSVNPINWIHTGLKYKRMKPDVIIFRYWMPFFGPCFGTFARIVKQNNHTKIIAITDNIVPHEQHFYDRPATQYFLKTLDGAVTMSKKVLTDLQTLFPQSPAAPKATYHPHPLYDNFGEKQDKTEACKRLGLDATRKYILFFGFIRKYKGLDLLLEAFEQAADQMDGWDLLIAGEFYEDAQPYLDLVSRGKLESRIHLHTKFIPNGEVSDYFSVSDIVAQPYRNATQSGVSQVAYHFEVPMIITNVGGLAELVPHGEAGWVCEPTVEGLSEALIGLSSGDEIARMRQNLPELKKQFSWSSMVDALSAQAG